MPQQLLETKLYLPRPRPDLVARPRLSELLDHGAGSRLTVVSAPPGFGKSTLVAAWLAASTSTRPAATTAWVSLDPGDNDGSMFWAYVIRAAESASVDVREARSLLDTQGGPIEPVLTALLNALGQVPHDVTVVLDDYHVVTRPDIHDAVAFLVDHLPPNAHLVLVTRADPPLPLARLRARGDLVEIRAADLRFTPTEAEAYLNGPMALALSPADVAALEGRTEGWIAALQLAAVSLGGRTDPRAFIAQFAGDDRYIVDYLVEEVLERQSVALRQFLLETSILDRLTGSLCDAVTASGNGGRSLELLERSNLFVVPLDDRRRWYRYHHLFADVLRARLLAEQPELVPTLHARASRWFEEHDDAGAAIDHALAAGDIARAADLIEAAAPDLFARRQEMTVRRWLDVLPDDVFDVRPALAILHAGSRLSTGEATRVDERLLAAERWIGAAEAGPDRASAVVAGMVVRNPAFLERLPSMIPLYRAALARMRGDLAGTIANAEAALAAARPEQALERGAAAGMLALAHWTRGDLDAAYDAWAHSFERLEAAGYRADLLGLSIAMADIRVTQGRLGDARSVLERGLRIATEGDGPPLRGMADMHVGLAEIDRQRNDVAGARAHVDAAEALGEQLGLPQNPYRLRAAQAGLAFVTGDMADAVRLLDEAERRYDGDFYPDVRPIAARRARVWLRQGALSDASAWSRDAGLAADDRLTFLHEFDHATLARLLLAEGVRDGNDEAIDAAIRLAERLLVSALEGGRHGSAVDLLVVIALARHARRDIGRAASALDRAVALAEPDGWMRVFLDEGVPMAQLLAAVDSRSGSTAYLSRLRADAPTVDSAGAGRQPLIEPLSERELDVLRLLQGDLNGPDMARELNVSLNTLRTHTKSIYTKLGVNNRRAAIRRAGELQLLRGPTGSSA